jgi:hypothetical protein
MLSLIEVQCPHCGARGQIMVPPVGAIIIGPCPQCSELVTVFCGQVLPLEKAVMESGSIEERREHLLETLNEFLRDRIERLITDEESAEENDDETAEFEAAAEAELAEPAPEQKAKPALSGPGPITQNEFDQFMDVDLKLLDNKNYFDSVFGIR